MASFIDSFNAMFHHNESFAPVQKFHYLKSCLQGQPSDVIRSIPTTGQNYLQSYHTLTNRYENKGVIIQSHIRSLLDTPKFSIASATILRKLHHHVMSNVNALKALEQPIESWDAWLVTLICCRLDSVTVGEWQLQYNKKDLPSFNAVEAFLFNRIAAYEVGDINVGVTTEKKSLGKFSNPKVHERKYFLQDQLTKLIMQVNVFCVVKFIDCISAKNVMIYLFLNVVKLFQRIAYVSNACMPIIKQGIVNFLIVLSVVKGTILNCILKKFNKKVHLTSTIHLV